MHYSIRNKFVTYLIFSFLIVVSSFAQTDWQRWEKSEPDYLLKDEVIKRDFSYQETSFDYLISKSLVNIYWIFVSDVDGDNCPFYPSCSSFLVGAIDETNVVQGTLMFFDRFTRDSNPVNRQNRYPIYKNFRFYDPPQFYSLNKSKISYIPAGKVVH